MKTVKSVLPVTYYADDPTPIRVERLVRAWFRAMTVNQRLEDALESIAADGCRNQCLDDAVPPPGCACPACRANRSLNR